MMSRLDVDKTISELTLQEKVALTAGKLGYIILHVCYGVLVC